MMMEKLKAKGMPGPKGKDPMLDIEAVDAEMAMAEPEAEANPMLAKLSDDEIVAEAKRRGMEIAMPESEEEDMEMELEPAEDYEELA